MKKTLLFALVLYLVSAGVTYGVASMISPSQAPQIVTETPSEEIIDDGGLAIDPSEPRDQVCPLNGQMYTKTEKDVWSTRRPLAIMIENSPDARPQSGLIKADVVFEAMAEGGVTRFMGMYLCDATRKDTVVAPVRSARTYFIDWASSYNYPLYVHVGGANTPGPANALGQLGDYGWNGENDLNQFSIGYPVFKRDYNRIEGKEVATEHTMVSSTELLWNYAKESRDWTNLNPEGEDWQEGFTPWTFVDEKPGTASNTKIAFEFWDGFGNYAVRWEYDAQTNSYKRFMANEAHKDLETGEQIAVKNAIVLFSKEKGPIDELKHMLYQTTGTGTALIFSNGGMTEVNWAKPKRESALVFTDKKGKPVELVRGKTWISVVNVGTKVEY